MTFTDDDGVDPLIEPTLNNAMSITKYMNFEVTEAEAGRPELISFHLYNTVQYWKEIMAFNGITDVRQLVAGYTLRAPDRTQLLDAKNNSYTRQRGREVSL